MKAAVLSEVGGHLHVEEMPRPQPRAGEVLIKGNPLFSPILMAFWCTITDKAGSGWIYFLGLDQDRSKIGHQNASCNNSGRTMQAVFQKEIVEQAM